MLYPSWSLLLCAGGGGATPLGTYLLSLCPGKREAHPRETSTPPANASEHDTPLLCQARDNPDMSKHDKGYGVKASDRLLSQNTRHILGQTNRHTAVIKPRDTCCVKARDTCGVKPTDTLLCQSTGRMLCQSKRHAAVSNHETHFAIKPRCRCCDAHGRRQTLLLCHSTVHQTVRALPSIEHSIHSWTQYPYPGRREVRPR